MRTIIILIISAVTLSGCGLVAVSNSNKMSPEELTKLDDYKMCHLMNIYGMAMFAPKPTPAFLQEFQSRGIYCDNSGFGLKVVYLPSRIAQEDDKACKTISSDSHSKKYIDCRNQLEHAHEVTAEYLNQQRQADEQRRQRVAAAFLKFSSDMQGVADQRQQAIQQMQQQQQDEQLLNHARGEGYDMGYRAGQEAGPAPSYR